jgi:hypothetical protein
MNFKDNLRLSIKENAITATFDELSYTTVTDNPANVKAHQLYLDGATNVQDIQPTQINDTAEILQDALTTILPYTYVAEPTATGKEHEADCMVAQIVAILKGSALPTPPNYAIIYNLLGEALQIIQDLKAE